MRKITIPSPTSPTTLKVPATAPVLSKKPLLVLVLGFVTPVGVGVVRTMVVKTMVLPSETVKPVDGDSRGGEGGLVFGLEGGVVVGDVVGDGTGELGSGGGDDGGVVVSDVVVGVGVVVVVSVSVGGGLGGGVVVVVVGVAGGELQEHHKRLIFYNYCDAGWGTLTVGVWGR